MLQGSLDSGNAGLQLPASVALFRLMACDGGAAAVAAGGAIPPLVQLLLARRGQPIAEADRAAVGALLTIAQEVAEQHASAAIQQSGAPALLALIERRSTASAAGQMEEQALLFAAAALRHLAGHDAECQAAVVAAGGVRGLASLLSQGSTELLLKPAMGCALC